MTSITLKRLAVIVPAAMCLGAGIELFMIKTGFYEIVTRLESERRYERKQQEQQYKEDRDKFKQSLLQQPPSSHSSPLSPPTSTSKQ